MRHPPARDPPAAILFHELLQTAGRLKHFLKQPGVVSDDFKHVESHDCPMPSCAAPQAPPCRTGKGKVAIQYHIARFRLVSQLAKMLSMPAPAVRKPGSAWTELPRPATVGAEPVGRVRLGYACASNAAVPRRAARPSCRGWSNAPLLGEDPHTSHHAPGAGGCREDHRRNPLLRHRRHPRRSRAQHLGRGHRLAMLAERLKASDVGREFLTGELKGSHEPSGIVFTVLAAMPGREREYIRDRTLEGPRARPQG